MLYGPYSLSEGYGGEKDIAPAGNRTPAVSPSLYILKHPESCGRHEYKNIK
jgi:hypothetical protein